MRLITNPVFWAVTIIILLAIPALKSLTIPGLYTSHDGETHTARITAYYQALADGQIPPRIAGNLVANIGSPIFVYIYPLPYILGSIVHAIGFSYVDSFKIIEALAFVASAVFCYLWLKQILKSDRGALLGAIFYTWVPYRFSLLYVRASISEHLAYTFLPLILYGATKLKEKQNLFWAALVAVATSGLLLSQNLVALIALPLVFAYILIIGAKSKKFLVLSLFSLIWGFAISAFSYAPALLERDFTRFNEIIKVAYPNHFVSLWQLIRSPWGFGFDMPGTNLDQMSFQLGLAQILVLLLAVFLVLILWAKKKFSTQLSLATLFILVVIISIFLMWQNPLTVTVWQKVKLLHVIDIPWRLIGLTTIPLAFLAGYVAKNLKPGIIFIALLVLVIAANRNHLKINLSQEKDDNFFKTYSGSATQYDEFTTSWRHTTKVPDQLYPLVEVTYGEALITSLRSSSKNISFVANVKTPTAQFLINKIYFPEVEVKINGERTDYEIIPIETPVIDGKDITGLIQIDLDQGASDVSIEYKETQLRYFASLISLFSITAAAIVVLRKSTMIKR